MGKEETSEAALLSAQRQRRGSKEVEYINFKRLLSRCEHQVNELPSTAPPLQQARLQKYLEVLTKQLVHLQRCEVEEAASEEASPQAAAPATTLLVSSSADRLLLTRRTDKGEVLNAEVLKSLEKRLHNLQQAIHRKNLPQEVDMRAMLMDLPLQASASSSSSIDAVTASASRKEEERESKVELTATTNEEKEKEKETKKENEKEKEEETETEDAGESEEEKEEEKDGVQARRPASGPWPKGDAEDEGDSLASTEGDGLRYRGKDKSKRQDNKKGGVSAFISSLKSKHQHQKHIERKLLLDQNDEDSSDDELFKEELDGSAFQKTSDGSALNLEDQVDLFEREREQLTGDMVSMVGKLKYNSLRVEEIIRKDNSKLEDLDHLTELNLKNISGENKSLAKHNSGVSSATCWYWIILLFVALIFVWMILLMKMFPKRR
ncbi:SNAP receptor use1 [Balamuthia mandrillaris]